MKGQMRDGGRRTRDEGEERKQKRSFPPALLEKFNKASWIRKYSGEKHLAVHADKRGCTAKCSLTSSDKIDRGGVFAHFHCKNRSRSRQASDLLRKEHGLVQAILSVTYDLFPGFICLAGYLC